MHAVESVGFCGFLLFFFLMGLFVSGGEVGKGKAGREIRIKQMSFLQPTAPEVCWSSAWKQDGAIPRKSCYCAELHLLKDLFGFFFKRRESGP